MSNAGKKVGVENPTYESDEPSASSQQVNVDFSESSDTNRTCDDDVFYDFDEILKEIGALGKYQIMLVLMAYWITIPAGRPL